MPVLVGTSGWQYRDWRGVLYPPGLPERNWLEHYASRYGTVENNGTFYRLPAAETFAAWRAKTPGGFVMTVKASRYLTHVRRLREWRTADWGYLRFHEARRSHGPGTAFRPCAAGRTGPARRGRMARTSSPTSTTTSTPPRCTTRPRSPRSSGGPAARLRPHRSPEPDPEARVVYVDNDPLVLLHVEAPTAKNGTTRAVQADMRDAAEVLAGARELLDFTEPVALMFVGWLHHLADADDPAGVVVRYLTARPEGGVPDPNAARAWVYGGIARA